MTAHVILTPFATPDPWNREYHVAVMRATCDLTDDGELRIVAEQTPVVATDEYFGEPTPSGRRRGSDPVPVVEMRVLDAA